MNLEKKHRQQKAGLCEALPAELSMKGYNLRVWLGASSMNFWLPATATEMTG